MNISFERSGIVNKSVVIETVILSMILLFAFIVPPFQKGAFTVCFFKNITGLPCPGCGMTRAFLFLGHGRIYEAIELNPNVLIIFPIVIFYWLNRIINIAIGKEVKVSYKQKEIILFGLLFGLLMIAVWVYNLFFNTHLMN